MVDLDRSVPGMPVTLDLLMAPEPLGVSVSRISMAVRREVELDSMKISGLLRVGLAVVVPRGTPARLFAETLLVDGFVSAFLEGVVSPRMMGAGLVVKVLGSTDKSGSSDSGPIRLTCKSDVSRSRRSCTRGRFRNGSRGVRAWVVGGPVKTSVSSRISLSVGPRNAFENDLSGTKKPAREGLPAAVVAGIFGLGFARSVVDFGGLPKRRPNTFVDFAPGESSSKLS